MGWWSNYLASWVSQLSGLNSPIAAVFVAFAAVFLWTLKWHYKRQKEGKTGVENWHLLLAGLAGTWVFLSLTFLTAGWAIYAN